MTGTMGTQQDAIGNAAELLDGKLAIHDGNHDALVGWMDGPVDDQQIAVVDAEACHRVTRDPDEKGGFLMLNEMLVQAEATFGKIRSRRGETGRDGEGQHRAAGQRNAGGRKSGKESLRRDG